MEAKAVMRALSGVRALARAAAGPSHVLGSRGKHQGTEPPSLAQQSGLSTQSCQKTSTNDTKVWSGRGGIHPVFTNIEQHRAKVAVSDVCGDFTYEDVYLRSWDLAKGILGILGQGGSGQRVAFLCPPGVTHVLATWACWLSGQVAVPLCPSSPLQRLHHQVADSTCSLVVTTRELADRLLPVTKAQGTKVIVLDDTWWADPRLGDLSEPLPPPLVEGESEETAMLLYTSGATSGSPRGVTLSHSILGKQIERVVDAWDWTSEDSVLHCIGLGSTYGLINSLQAPLSMGAKITLMPQFDPLKVWSHLLGVGMGSGKPIPRISTLPAVPAMYIKLLAKADEIFKDKKTRDYVKVQCSKRMRLMMSSTATLPPPVSHQWRNVTGHRILENYVTTETGTAFCNRVAGSGKVSGPGCRDCGAPTPHTRTRIVRFRDHTKTSFDVLATGSCAGTDISDTEESVIGELQLTGEQVAKHYWVAGGQVPIETREDWLDTADIVQVHQGCYRVRGRLGIENFSSRGTKVNLRNVERKLLTCPDIQDCSVVGLGDSQSEERVAAVVVLNPNKKTTMEDLLKWCNDNMEEAEVPTLFKLAGEIVKESTGHVAKLKLAELFPETELVSFHDKKM